MLHIYFEDYFELRKAGENGDRVDGMDFIWNVEGAFEGLNLTGSKEEKSIIQDIDKGEYLDNFYFIDRFGSKIQRCYLSTGCKAALVVLHNPDKLVNTVECGKNALGTIITYCKEGNIPLYTDLYTIPYAYPNPRYNIDVMLEGHHFTDFRKLNQYIDDH